MGKRTGMPRGRPKGAKNKRTVEREAAMRKAAEAIAAAIPEAFEGDAHALLMATYKDTALPLTMRLDAAKAAIGYEKPRLAAREVDEKFGQPVAPQPVHGDNVRVFDPEEIRRLYGNIGKK